MNTIKRADGKKQLFYGISKYLSSSTSFKQGDILVWDQTNKKIKAISAATESEFLLGVAQVTVENGKIKSPYPETSVDASTVSPEIAAPIYGVQVELKLKSGETLQPGQVVYADPTVDAQTVKASGGTGEYAIGIYDGKQITSSSNETKVLVTIGCRYPDNSLKF